MLELIVVGLGPAGLALAHRAQQRGLRVLGIDPAPHWRHTIGLWADEIPAWLDAPVQGRCTPKVRANGFSRELAREYVIIDSGKLQTQLTTFPVVREHATITSPTTVSTGPAGRRYTARRIIDARGWRNPEGPVQQAAGYLSNTGEAWWMDFHGKCFNYTIPFDGRWLVEKTLLITEQPVAWQELEGDEPAFERVLFPMRVPPYTGPAIPFGVRAGMLNPITGYSVAAAWRSIDQVIDGTYPWRRISWKIEHMLLLRAQRLLLGLGTDADYERFFEEVFRLDDETLREFLELGNLAGTLRGMWRIFRRAPWLRRACIRAMLT